MTDAYDTKTVRFHLEERGQYLYVMLTRFDGPATILDEIGYRGEYIQFQTMSLNKATRMANTDPFDLAHKHPYPLTELYPFDLLYALDTGQVPWAAITDGAHLTESDVSQILEAHDE